MHACIIQYCDLKITRYTVHSIIIFYDHTYIVTVEVTSAEAFQDSRLVKIYIRKAKKVSVSASDSKTGQQNKVMAESGARLYMCYKICECHNTYRGCHVSI